MDFNKFSTDELAAMMEVMEDILEQSPNGQPVQRSAIRNRLSRASTAFAQNGFKVYSEFPFVNPYILPDGLHLVGNAVGLHRVQQALEKARQKGFYQSICFSQQGTGYSIYGYLDLAEYAPININLETPLTEHEQEKLKEYLQAKKEHPD